MGFTRAFREELARVEDRQACCRMAAAAGLVHTAGTFLIKGGASGQERYEIRVATTVQGAAKMVYSQFKALGAEGQFIASREPRFRHRLVYEVHMPGTPAYQAKTIWLVDQESLASIEEGKEIPLKVDPLAPQYVYPNGAWAKMLE